MASVLLQSSCRSVNKKDRPYQAQYERKLLKEINCSKICSKRRSWVASDPLEIAWGISLGRVSPARQQNGRASCMYLQVWIKEETDGKCQGFGYKLSHSQLKYLSYHPLLSAHPVVFFNPFLSTFPFCLLPASPSTCPFFLLFHSFFQCSLFSLRNGFFVVILV